MYIRISFLYLFINKFNNAIHRNLRTFSLPYHKTLTLFIDKFLISSKIVLGYSLQNKKIVVFLSADPDFSYYMQIPNKKKTSFHVPNKYLSHLQKSTNSVVKDFYILQTKDGLLSFDDALSRNIGGSLFLLILFFNNKQKNISKL